MTHADVAVNPIALREQVKEKYREVAEKPDAEFHFHTGRPLAARCGYGSDAVDGLPDVAVEAFAGVANPFALRPLESGERVVDIGSGAGMDSFLAGQAVGPQGRVVGVEMTQEMLARARRTAEQLQCANVEFREGLAEELPVEDGWADVVIANGALNLVAEKRRAFAEIWRVLRPGGVLQFADIATERPVADEAIKNIDLWTA